MELGGQVNGVPTPTLDAFLTAVKDIGHKSPVRVKTVSIEQSILFMSCISNGNRKTSPIGDGLDVRYV